MAPRALTAYHGGITGDPPNFILQGITYNRAPATVVYLHLSPGVLVKEGDEVKAGQHIAFSGHNGHSTAPHLHVSAMRGHRFAPFDYLTGLSDASPEPTSGVAANKITIFPPRLVYPRQPPHPLARGRIVLEDLHIGVTASDTVKRLQHRLNQIPLEGGAELPVTGNYLEETRAEVKKWQIQKRHAKPGTEMANGDLHPQQARILFGKRFDFVHAHGG